MKAFGAPDGLGGAAQEDPASGETSSPSDGTFWHITSVLKTGGWSVRRQRGQDRFVRDRATEPRRALSYRVPVLYGAAIFALPSKIASLVFGSSTEASARCMSWLSRAD